MPERSVYLHDSVALGALGSGTVTFGPTGAVEHIIHSWTFESTGTFRLRDIRDTAGNHYVADETGQGITSAIFLPTEFTITDLMRFVPAIALGAGMQIHFDLVDISGAANTVAILLKATRAE